MNSPLLLRFLSYAAAPLLCGALALAATESSAAPNSDTVLVEVDGAKLTVADLERKNPTIFFAARNGYYEAQRKAIEQFTDEYLLERQAKKEGVTVEELLKTHLNASLPKDPSEE